MSWQDRPYAGQDSGPQPELRLQFRKPSTAVTWLIIANVAVFFVVAVVERFGGRPDRLFGLFSVCGVCCQGRTSFRFRRSEQMRL